MSIDYNRENRIVVRYKKDTGQIVALTLDHKTIHDLKNNMIQYYSANSDIIVNDVVIGHIETAQISDISRSPLAIRIDFPEDEDILILTPLSVDDFFENATAEKIEYEYHSVDLFDGEGNALNKQQDFLVLDKKEYIDYADEYGTMLQEEVRQKMFNPEDDSSVIVSIPNLFEIDNILYKIMDTRVIDKKITISE